MPQRSKVGQFGAPGFGLPTFPLETKGKDEFTTWIYKKTEILMNDEGNLRVDMDGVPLEGNKVFSCVQQNRFRGMLCLILIVSQDSGGDE